MFDRVALLVAVLAAGLALSVLTWHLPVMLAEGFLAGLWAVAVLVLGWWCFGFVVRAAVDAFGLVSGSDSTMENQ